MRACMSDYQGFRPSHDKGERAHAELRAILSDTADERGEYVACYASLAYLKASRMPTHVYVVRDLVAALSEYVSE